VYGRLKRSNPQEYELRQIDLLGRKVASRDRHLQASLRYATKTQKRQVIVFLDNIDRFTRGDPLREVVDPGEGY